MVNNRSTRFYFFLAVLEGSFSLLWLLMLPSIASRPFLLGLSRMRLALAGLILLGCFFFLLLAVDLFYLRDGKTRLARMVEARLRQRSSLTAALVSLIIAALLGLMIILWNISLTRTSIGFYDQWLGPRFSLLNSLISQSLPLIAWGVLLASQSLIWLVMCCGQQLRLPRFWDWKAAGITLLVWCMGLVTLFHWLALSLSLTVFTSIPGWHWTLRAKTLSPRYFLFIGIGLLLLVLLRWLASSTRVTWKHLALIVLFGYIVQVGMGVVDGKGIESLREKYYSTLHRSYTNKATSRDESVLASIRSYEEIYSNMLFPSTKPPGVMTIYIGLERTLNSFTHKTSQAERFDQLSRLISIIFPVLSLAAALLISFFTWRFFYPYSQETPLAALLAPVCFLLASNIVLFPLFLDQAFYPSLFLCASLPILLAFQRENWLLALVSGITLYVTIFFSFSLLPILALPVFYAVIRAWTDWSKETVLRQAGLLGAVGLGVVCTFFVFRAVFNYDFFTRYANAMSVVYNYDFYARIGLEPGSAVPLPLRIQQIIEAAFLNNLDFASLVSFPVFILFLVRGIKALLATVQRKAAAGEPVQSAFFLTYLALNAIGQMSGEAGRLWMFWVPVVVSLAVIEIAPLLRRRSWLAYALVFSQLITLLLTYHFQDLTF